jgi:hypothetical protein
VNKTIFIIFLLSSLIGCATSYEMRAQEYERRGDCQSAIREYQNSDMWMGARAYRIAAIYGGCAGDRANAIKWATLAARYENQRARDYLAQMGAPIPPADLYRDTSVTCSKLVFGVVNCN